MVIIEINKTNGVHTIENQSHRNVCWMDGYIEIPLLLETEVLASGGYCDLDIQDGVLVDITPTERPEPDPPTPQLTQLTTEEAIMDMVTENDYRTSLLELGIGGAI